MANKNYLDLTLDTTAPSSASVTVNATGGYCTVQKTVTVTAGQADVLYYKAWCDQKTKGNKSDAPATWTALSGVTNSFSFDTAYPAEGTYYYHVILKDEVANESAVFDTASGTTYEPSSAGPQVKTVSINNGDAYTTSAENNTITFTFEVPVSGIASAKLVGNILGSGDDVALTAAELTAKQATRTFTFNSTAVTAQGVQEVSVVITSRAGNTDSKADDIILDTRGADLTVALRNTADTANLGTWVNDTAFGVSITTTATDWAAYKIWGDFVGSAATEASAEYVTVTEAQRTAKKVFLTKTLTGADGAKNIYVKIKDTAGNESEVATATTNLDKTAPEITATPNKTLISKVSGYNEITLTLAVTEEGSGQKSYKIEKAEQESETYTQLSGASTAAPATVKITANDLYSGTDAVYKIYKIKVTVIDTVGNEGTTLVENIKLDTKAPVAAKPDLTNYNNYIGGTAVVSPFVSVDNYTAHASASDDSAMTMYCWISPVAADTTVRGSAQPYQKDPGAAIIDRSVYTNNTTNYFHVKYIDAVGNATLVHSDGYVFDVTVPGAGTISFGGKTISYSKSVRATITPDSEEASIATDKGYYMISGDCEEASTEWKAYSSATIDLTLVKEGPNTVSVKWRDAAGNIQTAAQSSATITLDQTKPTVSIQLYDTANSTIKTNTKTPVREFVVRLTSVSADANSYLFYGDFENSGYVAAGKTPVAYSTNTAYNVGDLVRYGTATDNVNEYRIITSAVSASENIGWSVVANKSNDAFKPISDLVNETTYYRTPKQGESGILAATTGDDDKAIYVVVRDVAGNTSQPVSSSFTLDTAQPEVNIEDYDFNIISKVHETRVTSKTFSAGGKTNGFCDVIGFKFTPTELIQAYKVCAYATAAAAASGSAASDAAIPTTAGSVNTSASGISSKATVTCLVYGADYETALKGAGDGAHYIVVYVQDLAGTWSPLADIKA